MTCMRCNSNRILSVNAHCRDLGYVEIHGESHDGYVPDDLGIGGDDDVDFRLCLDCGQMQGQWPLPQSTLERKAARSKVKVHRLPSAFAQSIVDHVIKTNDGDTAAVLAFMLDGWLTKPPEELVARVAECINALTETQQTCSMGLQLREVLEAWEHWDMLYPLITEDEDDDEESY